MAVKRVCDLCGHVTQLRFRFRAKRLEATGPMWGLEWNRIDMCDDCWETVTESVNVLKEGRATV